MSGEYIRRGQEPDWRAETDAATGHYTERFKALLDEAAQCVAAGRGDGRRVGQGQAMRPRSSRSGCAGSPRELPGSARRRAAASCCPMRGMCVGTRLPRGRLPGDRDDELRRRRGGGPPRRRTRDEGRHRGPRPRLCAAARADLRGHRGRLRRRPRRVAEYVAALGVAGINIEDSSAERAHRTGRARGEGRRDQAARRRTSSSTPGSTRTGSARTRPSPRPSSARPRTSRPAPTACSSPARTDPAELRELGASDPGAAQRPRRARAVPDRARRAGRQAGEHGLAALPRRRRRGRRVATGVRDGDVVPSATPYPEMQARLVDYARL